MSPDTPQYSDIWTCHFSDSTETVLRAEIRFCNVLPRIFLLMQVGEPREVFCLRRRAGQSKMHFGQEHYTRTREQGAAGTLQPRGSPATSCAPAPRAAAPASASSIPHLCSAPSDLYSSNGHHQCPYCSKQGEIFEGDPLGSDQLEWELQVVYCK